MIHLTKDAQRYTHYLRLVGAIEPNREDLGLDIYGERVLQFLARAQYKLQPVRVLQLMARVPGVSARTVHRRLQQLQACGFIALRSDDKDQRVKFVSLTANALALFERRGQMLRLVGGVSAPLEKKAFRNSS